MEESFEALDDDPVLYMPDPPRRQISRSPSTNGSLQELLKRYFGYDSFRPQQEEIIRDAMAGRDVFALLPTGGGKSLCYQLPAVARQGLTVVVSPLIALMKDQVDALQTAGIAATFLNSSLGSAESKARFRGLHNNQFRLLYVAPERLMLDGFLENLKKWPVEQFAIDEAHCISEWGHDFRPEYRQLKEIRTHFPGVPFMALTATATERVRRDIINHLQLKDAGLYVASFNRPNLTYRVQTKEQAYEQLLNFIKKRKDECGIVYSLSRRSAEDNALKLRGDGIKALPYHAGLEGAERARNQELFLRDEVKVICATIAFGMGINKPNVRYVVHYDLPKNIEGYYQETGRAGRDGLPSECLLLYSNGDVMKLLRFIDDMQNPLEQEHARKQIGLMVQYAECAACRRGELLKYFGETYLEADCGSCDNCLAPRPIYDGTLDAQKFLSCIYRIKERGFGVGMKHTAEVLMGANTENIRSWGHDKLTTYGIGKEHDLSEWTRIGRELLRLGMCAQAAGKFPTLELTALGRATLSQRKTVMLTKPADKPEKESRHAGEIECDIGLFEKLRVLRKELADARNVPAYVVFSDATLKLMAQQYPTTEAEFGAIGGVGEKKLKEFGDTFIRAILDFLLTNPRQQFATTTTHASATKSQPRASSGLNDNQTSTLRMFQSGKSVAEIAKAKGVTEGTVTKHLLTAIEAGEALSLERFAAPEDLAAIRDAFQKVGLGVLTPVHEFLGGKYSFDLLRICRVLMPGGKEATQEIAEQIALRKAELQTVFPKAYTPWGDEEDKRLLLMYAQKKTVEDIAEALGRQPSAIEARYLKLTDPVAAEELSKAKRALRVDPVTKEIRWTTDDEALLRALAKAGKKIDQLTVIMQRTPSEIREKLSALGIKI